MRNVWLGIIIRLVSDPDPVLIFCSGFRICSDIDWIRNPCYHKKNVTKSQTKIAKNRTFNISSFCFRFIFVIVSIYLVHSYSRQCMYTPYQWGTQFHTIYKNSLRLMRLNQRIPRLFFQIYILGSVTFPSLWTFISMCLLVGFIWWLVVLS